MDAIEFLIQQHDEMDQLIEQIESSDNAYQRALCFEELADKMLAHAAVEEKLLFPAIVNAQTEGKVLEAVEEHLSMKRLIADMVALDDEAPDFLAKFRVLKEQNRHHTRDEEEKSLFPMVRQLLAQPALDALGEEMASEHRMLLKKVPRHRVGQKTEKGASVPTP